MQISNLNNCDGDTIRVRETRLINDEDRVIYRETDAKSVIMSDNRTLEESFEEVDTDLSNLDSRVSSVEEDLIIAKDDILDLQENKVNTLPENKDGMVYIKSSTYGDTGIEFSEKAVKTHSTFPLRTIGEFTHLTSPNAPTWLPDRYYEETTAIEGYFKLLGEEPEDWDSNWKNYYIIKDNKTVGRLKASYPVEDDDLTTKNYVDLRDRQVTDDLIDRIDSYVEDLEERKVSQVSDGEYYKVYGRKNRTDGGGEVALTLAQGVLGTSIAWRDSQGKLKVGTPTNNEHATTKKYVDDKYNILDDSLGNVIDKVQDITEEIENLEQTTIENLEQVTGENSAAIEDIQKVIPPAAQQTNQLADKNYVNDAVNSVSAYYITKDIEGNAFETYSQLSSATVFYSGGEVRIPTRNDYCVVLDDEIHDNVGARYSYQNAGGWQYQYPIGHSPFTQEQLNALNSGATKTKIDKIATIENHQTQQDESIEDLQTSLEEAEQALNDEIEVVDNKIGDLSELTTLDNDNIVSAINEVNVKASANQVTRLSFWYDDEEGRWQSDKSWSELEGLEVEGIYTSHYEDESESFDDTVVVKGDRGNQGAPVIADYLQFKFNQVYFNNELKNLVLTIGEQDGEEFVIGQINDILENDIGNLVDLQTEDKDNLVNAINEVNSKVVEGLNTKLEMAEYIYDGHTITKDGNQVEFQQVKSDCDDNTKFVYLEYENVWFIPTYIVDNIIYFIRTTISATGTTKVYKITFNDEENITYTSKDIADKTLTGSLSNLETTSKTNLVAAINEVNTKAGQSGKVVNIGSYQYSYDGYVLPAIPVTILRQLYIDDKAGVPQTLYWTLLGTENNLKIVSSDYIGGYYSIDILVHNKYHCEYKWDNSTTGNVNPNIDGLGSYVKTITLTQSEFDALTTYQPGTNYQIIEG